MFRKKSFILRIGKYHVLLLQLNIYYKNNGESGWFNDLCLQELLMLLKEPIERRLSVRKLKKDKKTKKDEQVEIGTGTTMKFGFHFVEKDVYQSFVVPDDKDDRFKSLYLFEEKLNVTVCPASASSVEDKSMSILLNSSSQLPKEKVDKSDYFSKCKAIGKLATESAQKKKSKLKRIVKQGTKISEAQYKVAAGFLPDDGRWKETEKQGCNKEMDGGYKVAAGFIPDDGSWKETEKQGCNEKIEGVYIENEHRGWMEDPKGDFRENECNTGGWIDGNKGKETGIDDLGKVCNGNWLGGNNVDLRKTENGAWFADRKEVTVENGTEGWNVGSQGGWVDVNNGDLGEASGNRQNGLGNNGKEGCILDNDGDTIAKENETFNRECIVRDEVQGEIIYYNQSSGENGLTLEENNVTKCSQQCEDNLSKPKPKKCADGKKTHLETIPEEYLIKADNIVKEQSKGNDSQREKVEENEYCSLFINKFADADSFMSGDTANRKHLQSGGDKSALSDLTNISKSTGGSLDDGSKPPQTTDSNDDQRSYFTDVKTNTLQNKFPRMGRRSKLSLKRQNKDHLKANERAAKKARRSTSVVLPTADEILNEENISKEEIETVCSIETDFTRKTETDAFAQNGKFEDYPKLSLSSDTSINDDSFQETPKESHKNFKINKADFIKGGKLSSDTSVNDDSFQETSKESHNNLKKADFIEGGRLSSDTSVNDDSFQETSKESHKNLKMNKADFIEGGGEVRAVDNSSSMPSTEEDNFTVHKDQSSIKCIDSQTEGITSPKVNRNQSAEGMSDNDLFMDDTVHEDDDLELLTDLNEDIWIIGCSSSAQQISKHGEHSSRSPPNEVSSTDGDDAENRPVYTGNLLSRISQKIHNRTERDKSIIDIESDKEAFSLVDEDRRYCTSSNDDDLPEVSVNEQCDVREVESDTRDIDVEMVTSSDDIREDQMKYSTSSNQKQEEVESIVMSPELISDDDKENVTTSADDDYHCHEIDTNPVKQPPKFTSETMIDLTNDTSGDDLPNVSFSSHRRLHTYPHQLFDQSSDQAEILHGTSKAVINLNSPDPRSSPVFGKRKKTLTSDQKQISMKCSQLNFDSESEDPETVSISKKSKYKFKIRGPHKTQTTSIPTTIGGNCESGIQTIKDSCLPKETTSGLQQKPKKRFSQLWKEDINPACTKKKKEKNLFSFGITGGKSNDVSKGGKEIETISLLEDEYETELEESILQVRDIDELNLQEIAFMVWKNDQYLRDIFQGKSHFSERHENYKKGGVRKADLDFQVPLHMFSDEQVEIVVETLVKIFCSKCTKYWDYVMKVLLAEALIKIYMDVHHVGYKKAQEIINKMKDSQE